ncbi:hypothetical protein C8F01DRAFT_1183092 [Mycena amicta]|nr:hypothetical protein C8F01DRAFT_1183092 [Mycena amicta]
MHTPLPLLLAAPVVVRAVALPLYDGVRPSRTDSRGNEDIQFAHRHPPNTGSHSSKRTGSFAVFGIQFGSPEQDEKKASDSTWQKSSAEDRRGCVGDLEW